MVWKPAEKELTLDEAIDLAKKDLAHFWFRTSPILTAFQKEGKWIALPLDKEFGKKTWYIFMADPTRFSGRSIIHFAKEWHRRYQIHEIEFLLIFNSVYSFYKEDPQSISKFIEMMKIPFPLALDHNQGLYTFFGGGDLPKAIFISHDKKIFQNDGETVFQTSEVELQSYLRAKDPGLPLLHVLNNPAFFLKDKAAIDFGYQKTKNKYANFTENSFSLIKSEIKKATFFKVRPKHLEADQIYLSGNWQQYPDKIVTSDPNAILGFTAPSSEVMIAAKKIGDSKVKSFVVIEVNELPVGDEQLGEAMSHDELGSTILEIFYPNTFYILTKLSETKKEITIRFPEAAQFPIEIYGLRFGEK